MTPNQLQIPGTGGWEPLGQPPDISANGYLIGTSGYYFDDWVGPFNPPRQSPKKRLEFYSRYFSFVEINNTFYSTRNQSWFETLLERAAKMQFAIKVHRDISHTRHWDTKIGQRLMLQMVDATLPLRDAGRLFTLLIQLEDRVQYSSDKLRYLEKVASVAVENHIDVHIEFRHLSWRDFDVLHALKMANIGICNMEIPRFDHVFPLKSYTTTSKGYIRYSGLNRNSWYPSKPQLTSLERIESRNARYDYRYTTDQLRDRIVGQQDLKSKTETIAVAYNNHYSASAVLNAIENMQLLDSILPDSDSP